VRALGRRCSDGRRRVISPFFLPLTSIAASKFGQCRGDERKALFRDEIRGVLTFFSIDPGLCLDVVEAC